MKDFLHLLMLTFLCLAGALVAGAQPSTARPDSAPNIENFQLNGERWTCTADGRPLSGVLLKPEGKGPFAGIVLSHGLGGNAQNIARSRGPELVKAGFVCIATDYTHAGKGRGPAGGRANTSDVDFAQAGARPENIRRALACLEILRQQKEVDVHRLAAYGHSMGAFVTIALAAATDRLAAAAISSGGVQTTKASTSAAPTTNVAAQVRAPFLILQGALDQTVPPESSARFKQVLDQNEVPNERRVFEGVGHNVPTERTDEMNRLLREWFAKYGILPTVENPETNGAVHSAGRLGGEKGEIGSTRSRQNADAATPPHWVLPDVHAPHVQLRTFDSATVKTNVSYYIYTPEVYNTEKERRFPVLYWLHGSGGSSAGVSKIAAYFDAAIRAGKIPPMLVVFPNGLPMGMWCDWKDGSVPMETIVIRDLLPHLEATYRTIATREGRIIEGFSMGGYGAARLGFKYEQLFAAVSLLAAGPLQLDFTEAPRAGPHGRDQVLGKVFGDDMDYFKAQSPWRIAEQNATALRGGTRIRQIIGGRDETLAFNNDFHEHLTQLQIPHTFTVLPGVAHDPMAILHALGAANWEFYRAVLGAGAVGTPLSKFQK